MKVCVACEANVEGKRAVKVKEDRIIRAVRAVKKLLGIAKMNELYVCEADILKHAERRRSFEKSMLFATVGAAIILVLGLGSTLLGGRIEAWTIVSVLVIAGFLLVLPLFRYTPAVESTVLPQPQPAAPVMPEQPPAKPAKRARKKKKSR